ncbi:MAG: trehalose-phosphatase [Anaerolineales bacterium]|nr:trehalose-phosphatase [Anaerolineales bacterium]
MSPLSAQNQARLAGARHCYLFLDYDGTLADFAPTPDDIRPDPELIALMGKLVAHPRITPAIISGRRLAHIQALLPVPGLRKAGTYGVELELEEGQVTQRLNYETVRAGLATLKQAWARLLSDQDGFYLEDKGWTVAIHAKDAAAGAAEAILGEASRQAESMLADGAEVGLRLQGGHRFLEAAPRLADKGLAVEYLLARDAQPAGSILVYVGDDDKDEIAFGPIQARDGLALAVGERLRASGADGWFASPQPVRRWLEQLVNRPGH